MLDVNREAALFQQIGNFYIFIHEAENQKVVVSTGLFCFESMVALLNCD